MGSEMPSCQPLPVLSMKHPDKADHWRLCLEALLDEECLLQYINADEPAPTDALAKAEWRKNRARAYRIVLCQIDHRVVSKLRSSGWDPSIRCPFDLVKRIHALCGLKTETGHFRLRDLPPELQGTIISFLSLADVKALSSTCSNWRNTLKPKLFRNTIISGTRHELDRQLSQLLRTTSVLDVVRSFYVQVDNNINNGNSMSRPNRSLDHQVISKESSHYAPSIGAMIYRVLEYTKSSIEEFTLNIDFDLSIEGHIFKSFNSQEDRGLGVKHRLMLEKLHTLRLKTCETGRHSINLSRLLLDISPHLKTFQLFGKASFESASLFRTANCPAKWCHSVTSLFLGNSIVHHDSHSVREVLMCFPNLECLALCGNMSLATQIHEIFPKHGVHLKRLAISEDCGSFRHANDDVLEKQYFDKMPSLMHMQSMPMGMDVHSRVTVVKRSERSTTSPKQRAPSGNGEEVIESEKLQTEEIELIEALVAWPFNLSYREMRLITDYAQSRRRNS